MRVINKVLFGLLVLCIALSMAQGVSAALNDTVTDAWLFDSGLSNELASSIVLTNAGTTQEQGYISNGRNFSSTYITGSGHKTNLEILDNWTVNLWFNWSAVATGALYTNTGSGTERVSIGVLGSGQIGCALYNGTWVFREGESTFSDTTNYHMVTFTNDGSNDPKCYLDGVEVNDTPVSPPTATTAGFFLGTSTGVGDFFKGRIDEVTIWSQPLTSSQVSDMYNKYSVNSTQYPWTTPTPPPPSNFSITASNLYTGSAIQSFNASIILSGGVQNITSSVNRVINQTIGAVHWGIIYQNFSMPYVTNFSEYYVNTRIGGGNNAANVSLPALCLRDTVQLRSRSNMAAGNGARVDCYNNTDWVTIKSSVTTGSGCTASANFSSRAFDGDYNTGTRWCGGSVRTWNINSGGGSDDATIWENEIVIIPTQINYSTTTGEIISNITQNTSVVDVIVYAQNYFINTTNSFNTSANLSATMTPYTQIMALMFNGTVIANFSLNYSGGSVSTTNTTAFLPLFNNTYNVTLYNANYNGINFESKSVNLSASPYLEAYNFSLFFSNTFVLFFRNETTNLALRNKTVYLELVSNSFAQNYTITASEYNITLLVPEAYTLTYYYDEDIPRNYYVTLNNQSIQNLTLYTIDADISSFYIPVIKDESGRACQNATVSLLRYYIDINGYRTVEMARTDSQGQAVLRVQPNIIPYKLSVLSTCGNWTSIPTKLIDTSNEYTILTAQSALISLEKIPGVSTSLTYNNATRTFIYTWADTNNLVTSGCLSITKVARGTRSIINNTCSSTNSGSLLYTIPLADTNQSSFIAQGYITTNTRYSTYYTDQQSITFATAFEVMKNFGPVIALLLLLALILAGPVGTAEVLIGSLAALIISVWMGFVYFSWTSIISIIVFVVAVIYKLRGR